MAQGTIPVVFPVVAVASAGSGLRSPGSFVRCQVCAARWWGGGSVVWGIFGLQGFLREFFVMHKLSAAHLLQTLLFTL